MSLAAVSEARLDEFDRLEWWDVARRGDPAMTWGRVERDWAEFVRMKVASTNMHYRTRQKGE